MRQWVAELADLFFPPLPSCIVCEQPFRRDFFNQTSQTELWQERVASFICRECLADFHEIGSPYCRICGKGIDQQQQLPAVENRQLLCHDCRIGRQKNFVCNRSLLRYDSLTRTLIQRFKYRGQRHLKIVLAQFLLSAYELYYSNYAIDLLVPVPLHEERLAERGFNQAEMICEVVVEKWAVQVARVLVRVQPTAKQSKKGRQERLDSLERAFACVQPERVLGKTILLVDDIYTSGATADICAKTLLAAGAECVYVLTIAR